jgi:hypothetical protein
MFSSHNPNTRRTLACIRSTHKTICYPVRIVFQNEETRILPRGGASTHGLLV